MFKLPECLRFYCSQTTANAGEFEKQQAGKLATFVTDQRIPSHKQRCEITLGSGA